MRQDLARHHGRRPPCEQEALLWATTATTATSTRDPQRLVILAAELAAPAPISPTELVAFWIVTRLRRPLYAGGAKPMARPLVSGSASKWAVCSALETRPISAKNLGQTTRGTSCCALAGAEPIGAGPVAARLLPAGEHVSAGEWPSCRRGSRVRSSGSGHSRGFALTLNEWE